MSSRLVLFLILGLDALWLALQIDELSISYYEAEILGGDFSILQLFINSSLLFFGQNDFALRLPMIFLHILSALLLYKISKNYIKIERNRIWLLVVFILIPGVISSAIIINSAGVILFGLLLFVYVYENYSIKYSYTLLLLYMLLDSGFLPLFIALIIFSIYKRDKKFILFNFIMFLLSVLIYGFDAHGSPKGYFLDSIGIYAAVFSPIIFIYLFYVLYRRYLTKEFELLWFISTVVLVFSLLLSFRQRIAIEQFAPYLILAFPLIAQTFEHSYRVRLNMFRKNYRLAFIVSLVLLLTNSSVVFFNKYLYYFIEDPKKHFSYKMHVAKELAHELKEMGIGCVESDMKMSNRLEFYGVTKCNNYVLEEIPVDSIKPNSVTISYKNRVVYSANVTNININ